MDNISDLPMHGFRSDIGRRMNSRMRSRSSAKWIHAIPVIVLLCFFILWWFSYPIKLEIKDGRIIAVHRIEMPQPLKVRDTHVDLTILASATSPNGSVPRIIMVNNETEAQPVSQTV
ncbi:hypothetical protein F0562_001455 [Nyssa sinensis]|uniref:Uncharacterized protein n=1 Tax=Nyssa sinensis TaxID=561372 RepID=A0A5J5C6N0_9ASTE|nr:hypothetical protein F0562_001455 [Nyssa sinensis]